MPWYNPFSWFRRPEPPHVPEFIAPVFEPDPVLERRAEMQRRRVYTRRDSIEHDPNYTAWRRHLASGGTIYSFEEFKRVHRANHSPIERTRSIPEPMPSARSDDTDIYEIVRRIQPVEPDPPPRPPAFESGGGGDFGGAGASGGWDDDNRRVAAYEAPAPSYEAPAPSYDPPAPAPSGDY